MKKLIIAAAAIAMAVAANAAYVDWKVAGTSATSGYTVLLMTSAPKTSYESVADLKAAAISSGVIAKAGRDFVVGPVSVNNESVTTDAKFYYVLLASDTATSYNYIEATGMGGYVYAPPATGSVYDLKKVGDILAGSTGTIQKSPEPTPEPTSAMLMLLGVAGLALRRRQK